MCGTLIHIILPQAAAAVYPGDLASAIRLLDLDPKLREYIRCADCHCLYDYSDAPEHCRRRYTKRSRVCDAALFVRSTRGVHGEVLRRPISLFRTQPLDSWLKSFLQRPGIEDLLDSLLRSRRMSPGEMRDFWDSSLWESFKDNDGQPYTARSGNLVFALYIDFFNPLGNRQAGKKWSFGAIQLYCLNLPTNKRFRPENVYLQAIVPGPKKPNVNETNHILRPLVDDFKQFWIGRQISTFRNRSGRLIKAVILPCIFDRPALSDVIGFPHHAARLFCPWCLLPSSQINNFNRSVWPKRHADVHRKFAAAWRDASTIKEREDIWKEHGLRYSILLELPYFDPTACVVVDIMHSLILGTAQTHARLFWGLDLGAVKESDLVDDHVVMTVQHDQVTNATFDGQSGTDQQINEEDLIYKISDVTWLDEPNTSSEPTPPLPSEQLPSSRLMDDESLVGDDSSKAREGDDILVYEKCVFTLEDLHRVRTIIQGVLRPSFLPSMPAEFGTMKHGKLKAKEWQVLFTVYFVLALPQLWTNESQAPLLDNFASLVSAMNLACAYVTNAESADRYLRHMTRYLSSSVKLFPGRGLRPNHHYSLHIYDTLQLGPAPTLSAFAGERGNGQLARISTNSKIGLHAFHFTH